MKHELEQRIVERWPGWFDVHGSIQITLMPFGFEHSDGWFDIIWNLCEQLEPLVAQLERENGLEFKVLQVKEKFGGLRFYANFTDEAISNLILDAEAASLKTCEVCGKPGKPNYGGWIKTRCAEHRTEDDEDQEF